MNIPIRHHYSPEFYLSRWCGGDGKLCQLTKLPDGRVMPNRRYPKQTGFAERLYEIEGLLPEEAQQLESGFMRTLDTQAAEALQALEADDPRMASSSRLRSAWSRFILSLMLRDPGSFRALKDGVATQWSSAMRDLEERYVAQRGPNDPATFAAFLAQNNRSTDGWAMELAPRPTAHIPTQSNVRVVRSVDPELYRKRNMIERFFNRLKHFRGIATRYFKTAANFLAAIHLAAARLWIRAYESTT